MSRAQLTLRVYLDGRDPVDVTTRLSDHNLWDITRAKHKWPKVDEAPVTWLGFMAWAALRRTGGTDLSWESFLAECEGVENVDEDEEGGDVDPTRSAPGPA